MKFIKLNTLNPNNSSNDTPIHIKVDQISAILEASLQDKSHRNEIESVVYTLTAGNFAVIESPERILELIAEANI